MAIAPEPDVDSAPWWDGLRAHRIVLQRCDDCGRARFPPMPACPYCASRAAAHVDARGNGTVYSYVTAHQRVSPDYEGDLPYTVATVELDEGVRVLALIDPAATASIGDAVGAIFVDHDEWTELRFRVVP